MARGSLLSHPPGRALPLRRQQTDPTLHSVRSATDNARAPQAHQIGGEQRGMTGKAAHPHEVAGPRFAQVSASTDPKCPQLPKLMAQHRHSGPAVVALSGRRHGQRGQGRWGCSEAYACVVGRRTRRRGWLSPAEVQTGRIEGAGRQASVAKLGRPWAVRRRSTVANDGQQRPPGARVHRP